MSDHISRVQRRLLFVLLAYALLTSVSYALFFLRMPDPSIVQTIASAFIGVLLGFSFCFSLFAMANA